MAKKTRLDDSSEIYQPRDNRTDSQKFKEMTWNDRLTYINDYYKYKIIVSIIAVIVLGSLAHTMLTNKDTTVFSAAIINDYINAEQKDKFTSDFTEYLGIKESKDILIDESYLISDGKSMINASSATMQKLMMHVQANQIDVIIANENDFKQLANLGYFDNLADVLPTDLYTKFVDNLYFTTTEDDSTQKAYGISIKDSEQYKELGSVLDNPIIGIVVNSKFKSNSNLFLRYLYDLDNNN